METACQSSVAARAELTRKIKEKAAELGYVRCGITSVAGFPEYAEEITGRGTYGFFIREGAEGLIQGCTPEETFPGAKSIISLVWSFGQLDFPEELLPYIGRAYQARCYGAPADMEHGVRREEFRKYLHELGIRTYDAAGFLQVPDRAVAARAGVITYGRNNFAFADEYGSFIIITNIVTDADLETADLPAVNPCPPGCRLCIDACPTCAMDETGKLDPTRCILYNNFTPDELHTADLRKELGLHIHGCDECQTACPRNHRALRAPRIPDPLLAGVADRFDLVKLLNMDDEYYAETVRPVMFNYIRNMDLFRRNAAIAMGNSGDAGYLPALEAARTWATGDIALAVDWAIQQLS